MVLRDPQYCDSIWCYAIRSSAIAYGATWREEAIAGLPSFMRRMTAAHSAYLSLTPHQPGTANRALNPDR
eukprot:2439504-Rhodomonas_salina.1